MEKTLVPYKNQIKSSKDLVTSYEATRAGFIEIALEKNRKATPFVEEAKALQVIYDLSLFFCSG